MTHEPLMLSDTAMVLLREYIEVCDAAQSFFDESFQKDKPNKVLVSERDLHWLAFLKTQLKVDILRDLWHVWAYPDVEVVRYLDDHLVLNRKMMELCEMTFSSPQNHQINRQRSITRHPHVEERLMVALEQAYRQACLSDPQEPVEGAL